MKIAVLGGYGEMGKTAVRDLAETFDGRIIVAGRDYKKAAAFARSLKTGNAFPARADAADVKGLAALIKGCDVVVNCAQYYFNLNVMEAALSAGANYIDLGGLFHTTKKQLRLHKKFAKKNLVAVLGCGSTPGITNVMAAYGAERFELVEGIKVRFGGADYTDYGDMPIVVPYSMQTIFDEFTMEPAVLKNGRIRMVEPMYGRELYDFPQPIGRKRCFATLHSELATFPSSFKGLKSCAFKLAFPADFVSKVKFLVDAGFASTEKIAAGSAITPREVSIRLLNRFLPPPHIKVRDEEMLVVDMAGKAGGRRKRVRVVCHAKSSEKWNVSAGAVDTGVPPSIIAQMVAAGRVKRKGVLPPELCIEPEPFFRELKKRGMKVFISK